MSKNKVRDKGYTVLFSLMWKYKYRYGSIDLLRIVSSVSISFLPLLLAKIAVSINEPDQAYKYLIILFLVNIFHYVTWHAADYLYALFISPTFYDFKKIAFTQFWTNHYSTFIEKPSGKVGYYINQLPNYIERIYDSYHFGFLTIFSGIPVYFYLFYISAWQNSLIYGIFIIVTLSILTALARPMKKHQRDLTDKESSNSGRVFDSYANFVNVFSFRAHRKEVARNNEQIDVLIKKDIRATLSMMNYWAASGFLVRICLWPIIFFYSWHLFKTGQIPFTALVISVTVLVDFSQQFWGLVHNIGMWSQNTSQYREAYSYLFPGENIIKNSRHHNKKTDKSLMLTSALEIRDLSFTYPDAPDQPILKNINITVAKNEKIGIVGKSGSGKSTLIKILLGFYPLKDGQVLIDSKEVKNEELAQLYAYVPQDTTLFQESIMYNIAYACQRDVAIEEVKQAADKAYISEFIESLPQKYDTLVGERGVKLSLGQRQRIAIARAFLREADLLILDEATSSLDSRTESYVQQSFEELWGNKSVIAVAHRLSTLNNVDRIIVMSKGEIVEQGTKEELLALNGHFADLWNHQKQGMI